MWPMKAAQSGKLLAIEEDLLDATGRHPAVDAELLTHLEVAADAAVSGMASDLSEPLR